MERPAPTIFDTFARTSLQKKARAEPLYDYYNASARPEIAAIRDLLNDWFARYPEQYRLDLAQRFRSAINIQHHGALFELYLHELLTRAGFAPRLHPDLDNDVQRHPDFLLSIPGAGDVYLEATVAGPAEQEVKEDSRIAQVYDALARIKSPDFYFTVQERGSLPTAPNTSRLNLAVERWVKGLAAGELQAAFEEGGFDALPTYDWEHDGWSLTFTAVPKSAEHRGTRVNDAVIMTMPEVEIVTPQVQLRKAIKRKATRYQELGRPYIVALNCLEDFVDDAAVMDALLGDDGEEFGMGRDGKLVHRQRRKLNGSFVGPNPHHA